MVEMLLKDEMLITLMLGLNVPKEMLLCMSDNYSQATRVYKKLVDGKLITECKTTYRGNDALGDNCYTQTLCSISKEGLTYITTRHDPEWLEHYDRRWIFRTSIYDRCYGYQKSQRERVANISEWTIMAQLAGADIPVMPQLTADLSFMDDEAFKKYMGSFYNGNIDRQKMDDDEFLDDDIFFETELNDGTEKKVIQALDNNQGNKTAVLKKSITECVYEAMKKADIDAGIGSFFAKDSQMRFCDIRHMKELITCCSCNALTRGIDRARINGVIENANKTIALYSCRDYKFNWLDWTTQPDKGLLDAWGRELSIAKRERQHQIKKYEAALLIKNTRHLRQLIIRDKDSRIGKGFSQFFIIPKTPIGVKHLSWIMQLDCEEYEKQLTEMSAAHQAGAYQKNANPGNAIFPLYDKKYGCAIGYGFFLDIIKVNNMKKVAAVLDGKTNFGIMCFDWQVPFYKAMFPEEEYPQITFYSFPCPYSKV